MPENNCFKSPRFSVAIKIATTDMRRNQVITGTANGLITPHIYGKSNNGVSGNLISP